MEVMLDSDFFYYGPLSTRNMQSPQTQEELGTGFFFQVTIAFKSV